MATLAKKPIQIYLEDDQLRALRALSKRRNVSMAELVRQGVDRVLADVPPEEDPLWAIVGIADAEPRDLAERHDEYLVEATRDEHA